MLKHGLRLKLAFRYSIDSCLRISHEREWPKSLEVSPKGIPHTRWLGVPLCIGVLALCACAAPQPLPQAAPPLQVPEHWGAADGLHLTGADDLANWWQRFDDPLLTSLIQQAMQANTSVRSAHAALQGARALQDQAGAALWPVLGSAASGQSNRVGANTTNTVKLGLDASWGLDVFGKNRNANTAAAASTQASAASLGDVQVSIAAELALNYIAIRSAQERLSIARTQLASQTDTLQLTRWRQQAGLVSTLEAVQARASAEQTAALLPALQTTIDQSSHAIAVLAGQTPAALANTLATPQPVPHAPDNLALRIPADTLRQRLDVRAAQYQVEAAHAQVAQADAARAPSFTLGGSLGLSALTVGALTDGASVFSAVMASVSLPVFDGGSRVAQLNKQEAALVQANARCEATVIAALTEVENALVALRDDRARLLGLEDAAASATVAAQLARQRFASGLVGFQAVLETQRSALSTQDNVATARAVISADHVRLYKSLGGGWQGTDDPVPRGIP